MEKIPIIVVAGATASGKTALGIKLAKMLDGEIVSADSMQIYKRMDIGTAKPSLEEQDGIAHHLIDIIEPYENYSVASYTALAHSVIGDIYNRSKMPIMVGGTGLYINSVINDIEFQDTKNDLELREQLKKDALKKGNEYVYEILRSKDEAAAARLHPNDLKRVIRAIEVMTLTGKSIIEHERISRLKPSRYKPIYLAIDWDREILYQRIDQRVDIMMQNGLLKEAQMIYNLTGENSTAMQGLGYKEFIPCIKGEIALNEAVETLKMDTRRYAKRQLTWFRRISDIKWLGANDDLEWVKNIEKN